MDSKLKRRPPTPPMRRGHTQTFEAIQSFQAEKEGELSFDEGDILFILERKTPEKWYARLDQKEGFIPSSYVSCENCRAISVEAARRGNFDLLDECLKYGVSVNMLDKTGSTALHAASKAGHLSCVRRLLEEKTLLIDLQNNIGDTPLHCASYRGHADIVEILIRKKASTEIQNRDDKTAKELAKGSEVAQKFRIDTKRRPSAFSFGDYGVDCSSDSD